MPKPPFKTHYKIEYWSCGRDGKGHHHRSEHFAAKCIKDRGTGKRPKRSQRELKERNRQILEAWIDTGSIDYSVPPDLARSTTAMFIRSAICNSLYAQTYGSDSCGHASEEIDMDLASRLIIAAETYRPGFVKKWRKIWRGIYEQNI